MIMKPKYRLAIIIFLLSFGTQAQDPIFTQYFFMPETLNPAFTGTLNSWYTGVIHRSQWPDGNKKINTDFVFINGPLDDEAKMGAGVSFLSHREAFTNYNYSKVNASFAYNVSLNSEWKLRFGIEGGYGKKDYNFGNLLLEDQINGNTGFISANTVDPSALDYNDKIGFLDLSAGLLIYKDGSWFGGSIKHLNKPNISFRDGGNVPLEMFFTLHGGYLLEFDYISFSPADKTNLLLTANYMNQSQYNRLDIGGALEMDQFVFGATAVTNPSGKSSDSHMVTSVNLFSSIQIDRFVFGYSYDINTSRFGNNKGIHELSLTWQIGRSCSHCDNYLVKRPWGRNYEN